MARHVGPPSSLFNYPAEPTQPPFDVIPVPDHVGTGIWQESYYDPTSQAPAVGFAKLPSGAASIEDGKLTGDGFPGDDVWKQT